MASSLSHFAFSVNLSAVGCTRVARTGAAMVSSKWSHLPFAFMADEKCNSKITQLTPEGFNFGTLLGREPVSAVTVIYIFILMAKVRTQGS